MDVRYKNGCCNVFLDQDKWWLSPSLGCLDIHRKVLGKNNHSIYHFLFHISILTHVWMSTGYWHCSSIKLKFVSQKEIRRRAHFSCWSFKYMPFLYMGPLLWLYCSLSLWVRQIVSENQKGKWISFSRTATLQGCSQNNEPRISPIFEKEKKRLFAAHISHTGGPANTLTS